MGSEMCIRDRYGTGNRISLKYTRAMITSILSGKLDNADFITHEVFGLNMPTSCPNVPSEILSPKNTWADKNAYDSKANELANTFNKNFAQFADNANTEILSSAPKAEMLIEDSSVSLRDDEPPLAVESDGTTNGIKKRSFQK